MKPSKRLVADRFRRLWAIVELIAAEPGHSRRELSDRFHLSERQVQADLNIIRSDMHLPLVRRNGYRFASEGAASGYGAMDLREAQLLVMILRQAQKDRSVPRERLASLIGKLPGLFPAHLQPLVERILDAVMTARGGQARQQVFAAIGEGMLHGGAVKLHYADPFSVPASAGGTATPVIRPDLMLPYLRSWYVVGELQGPRLRSVMLDVDGVTAVTVAADAATVGGGAR